MSLTGKTILLLEDEPLIALEIEDLLIDSGATPLLASSLREARATLDRNKVDAAILDVNIHGEQSYEIAQKLAELGTPFIFATGYGDALHPDGFTDVPTLVKPYSITELVSALGQALASQD